MQKEKIRDMVILKVKLKEGVDFPEYKSVDASGFDLVSIEDVRLNPGRVEVIPTGLFFEIPTGYEVQIRSRSGLAMVGLVVMNSPGTVDSDFRGEIRVILGNLSERTQRVFKGDRIAQGILSPVVQAKFVKVIELSETERGEGGFGSTGI